MSTRRGTLIDPANYIREHRWFQVDDRIAFWDRYTKHWIVYYVEPGTPYQRGACDMYPNADSLIACEADQPTTWPEAA